MGPGDPPIHYVLRRRRLERPERKSELTEGIEYHCHLTHTARRCKVVAVVVVRAVGSQDHVFGCLCLLVVLIDFLVASMRFAVKFYVDLWSQNVKRTILDPFREKSILATGRPGAYKGLSVAYK